MSETPEQLQQRLDLVEQARHELGEQVQHLVQLLEDSRREIRWLKEQLAKSEGKPE